MEDKVVAYRFEEFETEFIFPVRDGQGWISQAQMEELFKISHAQIPQYIQRVFTESGLDRAKHVKKMYTLRIELNMGRTRELKRVIVYYSFHVAKRVGIRAQSKSAVAFVRWIEDVSEEIQQIDSEPLVETIDLRVPLVVPSAIDTVFKRWMRNSLKIVESNRFKPSLNNSIYDTVSARCLDLLKKVEEEEQ